MSKRNREFEEYVATCKFSIDAKDGTHFMFEKGEYLEYDGQQIQYGGETYPMPRLKSALNSGWLVSSEETQNLDYRPRSAEIEVRGATPQQEDTVADGSTEIADEEKVVTQVSDHEELTQTQNRAYEGGPRAEAPAQNQERQKTARGMEIQDVDGEGSEGREIGVSFNTPSKQNSKLDGRNASPQAIQSQVRQATKKAASRPSTKENPQRRHSEGIDFDNENVGERAAIGTDGSQAPTSTNPLEDDARPVGRVGETRENNKQPSPKELAQERKSRRLHQSDPEDVESDDELDPEVKESRYKIAKIVANSELPEWDFDAHWKKKEERLQDQDIASNPVAVRAIYASESEAMKKRIKRTHPEAFVK